MCDIDIKEWQDRLTDFEKIVLQRIYDQWNETGEWPKFLKLSVDVRDQGDLYDMAKNIGYGFITAGNRGKSGEECKLTVLGVALCEGSEKDLDNFINFIKYCTKKYIEDPEDAEVSSEELKIFFSLSDVETDRLCGLVYDSHTLHNFCPSCGKTGDGKYSFRIDYNILKYEHIENFEDYVSQLEKGYLPPRFDGTRGQKFADEEKSNSIKEQRYLKEQKSQNEELLENRPTTLAYHDFWDLIHPEIIRVAKKKFEDGHYADTVESSLKEIEVRVRKVVKEKTGEELTGTGLMRKAFNFQSPIIIIQDIDTQSGKDIQAGYDHIFAGAMQGIRNPKAHENLSISKERGVHFLFMCSLLMYILDAANDDKKGVWTD